MTFTLYTCHPICRSSSTLGWRPEPAACKICPDMTCVRVGSAPHRKSTGSSTTIDVDAVAIGKKTFATIPYPYTCLVTLCVIQGASQKKKGSGVSLPPMHPHHPHLKRRPRLWTSLLACQQRLSIPHLHHHQLRISPPVQYAPFP